MNNTTNNVPKSKKKNIKLWFLFLILTQIALNRPINHGSALSTTVLSTTDRAYCH